MIGVVTSVILDRSGVSRVALRIVVTFSAIIFAIVAFARSAAIII